LNLFVSDREFIFYIMVIRLKTVAHSDMKKCVPVSCQDLKEKQAYTYRFEIFNRGKSLKLERSASFLFNGYGGIDPGCFLRWKLSVIAEIRTYFMASHENRVTICLVVAPMAFRIPISFVLFSARNEDKP